MENSFNFPAEVPILVYSDIGEWPSLTEEGFLRVFWCGARTGIKSEEDKVSQILYFPFYPFLLLLDDLCCLVSSAEQPDTHPCRCVRLGLGLEEEGLYKMRESEERRTF